MSAGNHISTSGPDKGPSWPHAGDQHPVIDVQKVKISFDGLKVLDGISFVVHAGETKIILGESGSGKTVLVKLIAGLVRPDEGRIFLSGHEITAMKEEELMPIRKTIGVVFQETALFDSLTVRDNVAFRLNEEGGHNEEEIDALVRQSLGFVDLEDAIDLMPSDLSGGMRRRVAIARALITRPQVILYDEPTAGLDPLTAHTIVDLILKLRDQEGVSSVFVTHRLTDAFAVAGERGGGEVGGSKDEAERRSFPRSSFIVLKDGRIAFEGTEEMLVQAKKSMPFIREFLS